MNSKQVYFTYGTMKYSEQYEGTLQTRSVHFHSNRSLTRHNGVLFLFAAFDNFELFLGVPRGRRSTRWRRRARASAGSAWGRAGRRGRAGVSPPAPRPARRTAPNLRTRPLTDPALPAAPRTFALLPFERDTRPPRRDEPGTVV